MYAYGSSLFYLILRSLVTKKVHLATIFELFFCKKKYLLVGASGMLWAGESVSGSVDQWISGSVRDVCLSHQSD